MSAIQRAMDVMVRARYQLRPPRTTSMAPCRRCGRTSPGGQVCAECLTDDLSHIVGDRRAAARWLESMQKVCRDEQAILHLARDIDGA